ncbi:MAG: hypothetical protein EP343_19180 [Deltaproteobacteria bacterium]|nr:MAG: hypothetical protein EP343_19180 [Deltaproteobacteria bacterium]
MRRLFFLCCAVFGGWVATGCGGVGGYNFNWQQPGGDTQRPTDLSDTSGAQNDTSNTNIPGSGVHARLAVTKDGRYVLFTPTERKPVAYYQPAKQDTFFKGLDDLVVCSKIKASEAEVPAFSQTLRVLDLKDNKVRERTFSMPFPRLSVVLHPDNKSVFLAEYACEHPTTQWGFSFAKLVALHQVSLNNLKTLRSFRVQADNIDRLFHEASVHFWHFFPSVPKGDEVETHAMPSGQTRFVVSPLGNFIGLYRHAKPDSRGRSLFMLNLNTKSFRRVQLSSPLVQIRFSKDESALFAAASKEFDTVEQERRNRCATRKDRDSVPECSQLRAWTDLVRVALLPNFKVDKDALTLGYSVDHYRRIQDSAHGMAAMTPAFTLSPDQSRMVLSICDRVNWKRRSCSGELFLLKAENLDLERKIPGLGPAGFSPDGSTIVAWDGTRNDVGQVLVPLFPEEDDPYQHWLVLIDTQTWKRRKVDTPFEGPLYFVTPKGNFVATVSDLQGETMVITDLENGYSVNVKTKMQMAEFSVSSDGAVLYSVEQGGVVKMDLKRASQTYLVPPGSFAENVQVLPSGSPFQRNVTPPSNAKPTASQQLKTLRLELKGTVLHPRVVPWNTLASSQASTRGDSILVGRHSRQIFEIFNEHSQLLYKFSVPE